MDIPRITKPVNGVTPGVGQEILIAEFDWFDELAVPTLNTNYGDDCRIVEDHTFLTGKGFRKCYISNRDSELLAKYLGGQDSRAVMPSVKAFMPGINPVTTTFFAANKRYIVLVPPPDCSNTRWVQLGVSCRPAEIPPESVQMKGGKAESNDPSGHEFEVVGYQDKNYFYEGAVTLYP